MLKWAGGKRTLAPQIVGILREAPRGGTFYDVFAGGLSVPVKGQFNPAVINDINHFLTGFYEVIKYQFDEFVYLLENDSTREISKEFFKHHLERVNSLPQSVERAYSFAVVNRLAYGSKMSYTSGELYASYFSPNPHKTNRDFISEAYRSPSWKKNWWLHLHHFLQNAEICNTDYRQVLSNAKANDVIYLDPPYFDTHGIYSKDKFDDLACVDEFKRLNDLGCYVAYSNNAPIDGFSSIGFNVVWVFGQGNNKRKVDYLTLSDKLAKRVSGISLKQMEMFA